MAPAPGRTKAISSLGFIGAGNMATAIAKAVVAKGLLPGARVALYDILRDKADALAADLGARACAQPGDVLAACSTVVIATKPQKIREALEAMRPAVQPAHLIISIAAGVPASKIESLLPPETRVVRVMPNTPALIGMGAAGVAGGTHGTEADVEAAIKLFEAVGIAARVEEAHLDIITALSGSGPAYVFRFMEVLGAAGAELGLPPDLAARFTLQTFLGAARLAEQSPESLEELRRRVTSPGGTTAAALAEFEARGLESILTDAVRRARDRSIELAGQA